MREKATVQSASAAEDLPIDEDFPPLQQPARPGKGVRPPNSSVPVISVRDSNRPNLVTRSPRSQQQSGLENEVLEERSGGTNTRGDLEKDKQEGLQNRGGGNSEGASFKSSLLNGSMGEAALEYNLDFEVWEEDVKVWTENGKPSIRFSDRIHELIAEEMKFCVYAKLIGRSIGYRTLLAQLNRIWRTKGVYSMTEIGGGFFRIKFGNEEDYQRALCNGPWMVFGHYLAILPWEPCFDPFQAKINSIVAWVRLSGLPTDFYSPGFLRAIGNVIGDFIKLDRVTEITSRSKYARMAVSIDLTKPLITQVVVEGRLQLVEFEGLPNICFKCGLVGHSGDQCGVFTEDEAVNIAKNMGEVQKQSGETDLGAFSAWQLVNHRGWKNKGVKSTVKKSDKIERKSDFTTTSRFNVLYNEAPSEIDEEGAAQAKEGSNVSMPRDEPCMNSDSKEKKGGNDLVTDEMELNAGSEDGGTLQSADNIQEDMELNTINAVTYYF